MQEGRGHFCGFLTLQVSAGWIEEDRKKLYSELIREFTPGVGQVEEWDQDPWLAVAMK